MNKMTKFYQMALKLPLMSLKKVYQILFMKKPALRDHIGAVMKQ